MIISLDHVGITSNNIECDSILFSNLGYQKYFVEKNIVNSPEKLKLMKSDAEYHNICFIRHKTGIPIELIEYSLECPTLNSYAGLLFASNKAPCNLSLIKKVGPLNYPSYFSTLNNSFGGCIYPLPNRTDFYGAYFKVSSIANSINFWVSLGFRLQVVSYKFASLVFEDYLSKKQWTVHLIYENNISPNYLDVSGVNSLAFISTSPIKDRQKISDNGYITTSIFEIEINNRLIKIFFAVGPSGELVEIIGFSKI